MSSLPPLVAPVETLSSQQVSRGSRHLMLPGFGLDGQRRLAAARVLVIGAGGLGSPVLQYLAAAGVGTIGIVDFDTVDLSNLQRQVIHRTSAIGMSKTQSAAATIADLNPLVDVVCHDLRLGSDNALEVFAGYDLVVDGSDNFATRYLANDAAALLRLPYVWGSVFRFDGQVTVFWEGAPDGRSVDYRDLHPVPPAPGEVLSCDEAGVLGAVCSSIGSMMATEAIKLITGIGEPLLGRVQVFDALAGTWREVRVRRGAERMPVSALIDYDAFCGVPDSSFAILPSEVAGFARVLDVREAFERELVHIPGDRHVPLAEVLADPDSIGIGAVAVYCKTGIRSARAAQALRDVGIEAVSVSGGIQGWLDLTDPGGLR